MRKKYIALFFVAALSMGMPMTSRAMASIEIIEQVMQSVDISVSGSVLHVTGAAGLDLKVYNVTGVLVKSLRVDSDDKRYDLNLPEGMLHREGGKNGQKNLHKINNIHSS